MSQELTIVPNERAGQSLTTAPVMALPSKSEMAIMLRTAEILFEGGLLPESIKNHQAAFTIMLKGRELGISAMNAFASINVIKGKPTLSADLMVAILRRAGHKLWVLKSTDTECVMKGHRRDEPDRVVEIHFTYEDATRAGLTNPDRNGNPSTWMKYPAQLCYARCASRLARILAPDELAGMYTPEELGVNVQYNEDGAETVVVEQIKPTAKLTVLQPEPDLFEEEFAPAQYPDSEIEDYLARITQAANLAELGAIGEKMAGAVGKDHPRRKELVKAYDAQRKALAEPTPVRTQQAAQIFDAPEPEQTSMPTLAQSVGPNNALAAVRQLNFLRQTATERHISEEQLQATCWDKYGYGLENLTKSQATNFIDNVKQPV